MVRVYNKYMLRLPLRLTGLRRFCMYSTSGTTTASADSMSSEAEEIMNRATTPQFDADVNRALFVSETLEALKSAATSSNSPLNETASQQSLERSVDRSYEKFISDQEEVGAAAIPTGKSFGLG